MRGTAGLLLALAAASACAAVAQAPRPVGPVVLLDAPSAGGGGRFLGSESCRGCHPAAYTHWLATGHAREYAGLQPADRGNPACLRCHVTGYGEPLGFQTSGGRRDLAVVGCEACHGAGADHARSSYPALVPTLTGGDCPPCEVNRICRLCHTPERSADFHLSRALEGIACDEGRDGRR